MGRKQGVTPEETRAKLLEAAAQVFAERGYDGARVGEIARRAGLTTGAIYAHYGTKAELLAEAVRMHSPDELSVLLARGDTADMLRALRTAGHQLTQHDPEHRSLILQALVAGRSDPEVARLLAKGVTYRERRFALALRRMRAAGLVDATLAPEAVARLCTMLAVGGLAMGALGLEDVDTDDWTTLVDRLVASLAPPSDDTDDSDDTAIDPDTAQEDP